MQVSWDSSPGTLSLIGVHIVLSESPKTVTERSSGCLPLQKPVLEKQVLMQRKVVCLQMPAIWKTGDSGLKAHLHLTVEARVFINKERETEQRDQGRRLKIPLCAGEHSPCWYSKWWSCVHHPGLAILDSHNPDFMSPCVHSRRSANPLELRCLKVRVCIF